MTKIIIAVALAIAVVLFNFTYIQSVKQQYESGEFAWVIRATEGVGAYKVISPESVEVHRVDARVATGNMLSLPGRDLSEGGKAYLLNQVILHVTKTSIPEGAIINQAMVAENLEDAFSRKIPQGMRAVTISVTDETGVAGLIRPGDRVDIVGNFQVQAGKTATGMPIQGLYTQTMLQNVEVLAVGKDAGIGLSEELAKNPLAASEQFSKPSTLTLAVDPANAQKLIHVRNAGTLSASLRPGPYDPNEGSVVLSPIQDENVLETDAMLMLKSQAYNPFLQGGMPR